MKTMRQLVKTQFHMKVQILRTDNDMEFEMFEYYALQGMIHQKSCVKTSQHKV